MPIVSSKSSVRGTPTKLHVGGSSSTAMRGTTSPDLPFFRTRKNLGRSFPPLVLDSWGMFVIR